MHNYRIPFKEKTVKCEVCPINSTCFTITDLNNNTVDNRCKYLKTYLIFEYGDDLKYFDIRCDYCNSIDFMKN